jgi:hypothetical protein
VTTERHGGVSLIASFLRSATFSARGAEQDIVVKDGPVGQELYREGPFNNITVQGPFRRTADEITAEGLDVFVRRKRIENAQLGPVAAPSGRSTFPLVNYLTAWIKSLGGHRGRRQDR